MPKSVFGQVVIGPPGCGKTTYCGAMQKLLKELGRKVAIVNIDPANEGRKYLPDIDMYDLITLEDVMENIKLGPNGSLMYCMEFLEKNLSWLERKISDFQDHYFIFDCPGQVSMLHFIRNILLLVENPCHLEFPRISEIAGLFGYDYTKVFDNYIDLKNYTLTEAVFKEKSMQNNGNGAQKLLTLLASTYLFKVELYTHHSSVKNIFHHLQKKLDMRLCVVQLIDSHYCSDAGKFIATVLMALSSMLKLEMPQINVLSKIDLANKYIDKLQFGIDFYTEVLNLNYFIDGLDEDPITKKYSKLNEAIISLVEDYSLVSFIPLDVKNKKSLLKVRGEADKANGYVFGAGEERSVEALLACAVGVEYENETLRLFGGDAETSKKKETNLSEDLLWK